MSGCTRGIGSLPNEIFIDVLSFFPTRFLLQLTTTSHHVHDIVARIIHKRLLAATKTPGHQIVLESYLPSAKHTTPYFICDFLQSDEIADNELSGVGTLTKLRGMYSHYKPAQPEGDRKVWKVTATGLIVPATIDEFMETKEEFVAQHIEMESHESFLQLQSIASFVKAGRKINIHEGLTRVWRDWLLERSQYPSSMADEECEKKLLWSSTHQHTGFAFGVSKRNSVVLPALRSRVEDENVYYTLQYEELIVRTSQILFSLEQALEQEVKYEGKSIIVIR